MMREAMIAMVAHALDELDEELERDWNAGFVPLQRSREIGELTRASEHLRTLLEKETI